MTLLLAVAFGLVGVGIMLLMAYFQWRAFAQLAEISRAKTPRSADGERVHQLAAPGRAAVENSNARLLDVVGQLEKRIFELESGQHLLGSRRRQIRDLLAEGAEISRRERSRTRRWNVSKCLCAQPDNAEALVKKAAALEKLGGDEALACCDRAIAADGISLARICTRAAC